MTDEQKQTLQLAIDQAKAELDNAKLVEAEALKSYSLIVLQRMRKYFTYKDLLDDYQDAVEIEQSIEQSKPCHSAVLAHSP